MGPPLPVAPPKPALAALRSTCRRPMRATPSVTAPSHAAPGRRAAGPDSRHGRFFGAFRLCNPPLCGPAGVPLVCPRCPAAAISCFLVAQCPRPPQARGSNRPGPRLRDRLRGHSTAARRRRRRGKCAASAGVKAAAARPPSRRLAPGGTRCGRAAAPRAPARTGGREGGQREARAAGGLFGARRHSPGVRMQGAGTWLARTSPPASHPDRSSARARAAARPPPRDPGPNPTRVYARTPRRPRA
jgi:hypothetical protein